MVNNISFSSGNSLSSEKSTETFAVCLQSSEYIALVGTSVIRSFTQTFGFIILELLFKKLPKLKICQLYGLSYFLVLNLLILMFDDVS